MPLSIIWQAAISEEDSIIHVPVFGAELIISLAGDVIVDISWQLSDKKYLFQSPSDLALQIQRYLINPNQEDLQVKLFQQGSDYANKVWNQLLAIPVGQAISYSSLAHNIGSGARAVAGACRNNPFAGIIPCHRVVSVSSVGGFMGERCGEMVELKRHILECERKIAQG